METIELDPGGLFPNSSDKELRESGGKVWVEIG